MITIIFQLNHNSDQIVEKSIFNILIIDNFILPFLISLIIIKSIRIDSNSNMFKVLITNGEDMWDIFLAKYLFVMILLFIGNLIQGISILIFCHFKGVHFNQMSLIIIFIFSIMLSEMALTLVQLSITLYIKNNIISLCLGIGGSLISLITSGFLPKEIIIFLPWQYVSVLNPLVLNDNKLNFSNVWVFYVILIVIFILILFFVIRHDLKIKRRNYL